MKNLTESLERKYSLYEAFDESMPLWLAQALGASAVAGDLSTIKRSNTGVARSRDLLYKNPNADKKFGASAQAAYRIDYQRPRYEYGGAETYGLAGSMLNNGVDISKVKVEQKPLPDKILRASKKRPEIDVYHFDNGQVWARGYNDREICQFTGKTFGASSSDELVTHLVDYAVIQQNDSAIGTDVADLRKARNELKAELQSIPNYTRGPAGTFGADPTDNAEISQDYWGYKDKKRDKSGYSQVNIPRYVKVAKELEKKKLVKNAANLVSDIASTISDMKSQIAYALEDMDGFTYDDFNHFRNALDHLNDADTRYRDALNLIDRINAENDEFEKIRLAGNVQSKLKDIKQYLSYIENNDLKGQIKTYADWL